VTGSYAQSQRTRIVRAAWRPSLLLTDFFKAAYRKCCVKCKMKCPHLTRSISKVPVGSAYVYRIRRIRTCHYSAYSKWVLRIFCVTVFCVLLRISLRILPIFPAYFAYFSESAYSAYKKGGCSYSAYFLHIYCVFLCVFCVFLTSIRSEVSFQTSMQCHAFKLGFLSCNCIVFAKKDSSSFAQSICKKIFSLLKAVNDGSGKDMVWVLKI
jgi:hypothetical protein